MQRPISLCLSLLLVPHFAWAGLSGAYSEAHQNTVCDMNRLAECRGYQGPFGLAKETIKQECERQRVENGCVAAQDKERAEVRKSTLPNAKGPKRRGIKYDYSDVDDKYFSCDEKHLCPDPIAVGLKSVGGCAIGGLEFTVDIIMGVPRLVMMGVSGLGNAMKDAARCDANIEAKKLNIEQFNAGVINRGEEIFRGASRAVDWRIQLDETAIEDISCSELEQMMKRRALADEDEEMQRHINLVNKFGYDPERELGAPTRGNAFLNDKPKAPQSEVSDITGKIIKNMGIAWNCYNSKTQAEIACYAGLTALTVAIPILKGFQAASVASRTAAVSNLAKAAGVSEATAEAAIANAAGKAGQASEVATNAAKAGPMIEGGAQAAGTTSATPAGSAASAGAATTPTTSTTAVTGAGARTTATAAESVETSAAEIIDYSSKHARDTAYFNEVVANAKLSWPERVQKAGAILKGMGRVIPLGMREARAIEKAHQVGAARGGSVFGYTKDEIVEKLRILEQEGGFSPQEAKALVRKGIAGDPPASGALPSAGNKQLSESPAQLIERYAADAREIQKQVPDVQDELAAAKRALEAKKAELQRKGVDQVEYDPRYEEVLLEMRRAEVKLKDLKIAESNNYRLMAQQKLKLNPGNTVAAQNDYAAAAAAQLSGSRSTFDLLNAAILYAKAGNADMAAQVWAGAIAKAGRATADFEVASTAMVQSEMAAARSANIPYQVQTFQKTIEKLQPEIKKAWDAQRNQRNNRP